MDKNESQKEINKIKKEYEARLYELEEENEKLLKDIREKNDSIVLNLKRMVNDEENKYSECLSKKDNVEK
jgi:DNA anti-recombination protein RmuC